MQNRNKKYVSITLILLVLLVTVIITQSASTQQPQHSYNYLITTNKKGATQYFYAYNSNAVLVYGGVNNVGGITGTNPASVINAALANGGHTIIANGTYILPASTQITTSSISNGWLSGYGRTTNITSASNFAADLINVKGNGWTISDLATDGRHQSIAFSYSGIAINGENDTITNTFENNEISGCGIDSINTRSGTNYLISDNFVYGSHDGICAGNNGGVIMGNVVEATTTHNCYSLVSASDITLTGNKCLGSGNYGIAIEALGATVTNSNITITGNIIVNPAFAGIYIFATTGIQPFNNVVISSNTITDVSGINGVGIEFTGNSISTTFNNFIFIGNVITTTTSYCFAFGQGTANHLTIESNSFIGCGNNGLLISSSTSITSYLTIFGNNIESPTQQGIDVGSISNFAIQGNTIHSVAANKDGIIIFATSSLGTVESNTLISTGGGLYGIYLQTSTYITVSGNLISGFSNGIYETSSSDYNTISSNTFNSVATPITLTGTHDIVTNNLGFNPVAPSTYTACASPCTYTNINGYDETFTISAVNGISAWTCNGEAGIPITLASFTCLIPPQGTMIVTWAVTAPTFNKVPLVA